MPGGAPLATCTLPVGVFYLLTYRTLGTMSVSFPPDVSFVNPDSPGVCEKARRLIEYGCDNRGSGGPRANGNRIRMYAGPVL
jgi:hypothetical protein